MPENIHITESTQINRSTLVIPNGKIAEWFVFGIALKFKERALSKIDSVT